LRTLVASNVHVKILCAKVWVEVATKKDREAEETSGGTLDFQKSGTTYIKGEVEGKKRRPGGRRNYLL